MTDPHRNTPGDSDVRLDRRDPYLRLQSVTIYVRDLERSADFYLNQLGFQLDFDARTQLGRPWIAVSPPDGTANLVLIVPEADSEQSKLIGRSHHVTFITEDLIAKFREWTRRGVRFQQTPRLRRLLHGSSVRPPGASEAPSPQSDLGRVWGGMFARFRDPDGNSFSLVAFDEVTHAIETQRRTLAEKLEADRRTAQELEIAKQVQAGLFPQSLPPLRTLEFAGLCLPARHVGGDYYDFLQLGRERMGLVIGDISGKGIAAALLMANLQANVRSQSALSIDQPHRFLAAVNELLCANTADSAFATLFFAEYDDVSRQLRYVNCGHLPPLVLRSDGSIDRLQPTATILGAFREWDCTLGHSQLGSGDTLVLFTDGVSESFSPEGEEFGEERLIDAARRHRHLASRDLCSAIADELRSFSPHEQHDDVTLIVAKGV